VKDSYEISLKDSFIAAFMENFSFRLVVKAIPWMTNQASKCIFTAKSSNSEGQLSFNHSLSKEVQSLDPFEDDR
jgi:hypothetical protein